MRAHVCLCVCVCPCVFHESVQTKQWETDQGQSLNSAGCKAIVHSLLSSLCCTWREKKCHVIMLYEQKGGFRENSPERANIVQVRQNYDESVCHCVIVYDFLNYFFQYSVIVYQSSY